MQCIANLRHPCFYRLLLQDWPTNRKNIHSLILGQQFVKLQTDFQYPSLHSAILIVLVISSDSVRAETKKDEKQNSFIKG